MRSEFSILQNLLNVVKYLKDTKGVVTIIKYFKDICDAVHFLFNY